MAIPSTDPHTLLGLIPSTDPHIPTPPAPTPFVANQFSGIYILTPTLRHDILWERSGTPIKVNRKIPNPTYRTHFIGDR